MEYQIGDIVVHWSYGPGKILQMDEKVISGQSVLYYVVELGDMTLYVPSNNNNGETRLRSLTPPNDFKYLFGLLSAPAEPLSTDRFERRTFLLERMHDGKLESICQVVRDLNGFKKSKKMNDSDVSILDRAQKLLLNEWKLSLAIPLVEAEQELKRMLTEPALNEKTQ